MVLRDCAPGVRREVATYLAGVAGLGLGEEAEAGGVSDLTVLLSGMK